MNCKGIAEDWPIFFVGYVMPDKFENKGRVIGVVVAVVVVDVVVKMVVFSLQEKLQIGQHVSMRGLQ